MAKSPSKKMINRTLAVLLIIIFVGFTGVSARLVQLQLIDYEFYQQRAIDQQTRDTTISAKRGSILDRNYNELAVSASVNTVFISPNAIKDGEQAELIAKGLSEILGVDKQKILDKTKKKNYYEVIKKKVEKEDSDKVLEFLKKNKLTQQVALSEDTKRYYPKGNFASQAIGFTGTDGQGLQGVESYYDKYLKGVPGKVISAKDARGKDMPFEYDKYIAAEDGSNVVLTIDDTVQYYLEKNLETAYIDNKCAEGVAGIVMDVETGEILGMATKPDYDLNQPFEITDQNILNEIASNEGNEEAQKKIKSDAQNKMWRNKTVVDTYEPGSVFKILTSAMALEEKVTSANDVFTCGGSRSVADRVIHCWKRGGEHGTETFVQGIQNSCNPVFMDVAARLGAQRFSKYFEAFGLTEKTRIDLPGEATGIYHKPETYGPVELAVSSFGQTFKVTPIQLITAVSSVANDGKLMKPHIVKEICNSENEVVESIEPEVVRQTISKSTANELMLMLETVVSQGTAKNAYIKGYRIAGKTGTSEKIDKVDASGNADKRIASFVGLAPADDPKVAVLVMLDEPNVENKNGGVIAAPVVGSIMNDILPQLGVEPQFTAEELAQQDVLIPNLIGRTNVSAEAALRKMGIKYNVIGGTGSVEAQIPKAGTNMPKTGNVTLYTNGQKPDAKVSVPNLIGLTNTQANARLRACGLNVRIEGATPSGNESNVTKQSPGAGTTVDAGSTVSLTFTYKDEVQ